MLSHWLIAVLLCGPQSEVVRELRGMQAVEQSRRMEAERTRQIRMIEDRRAEQNEQRILAERSARAKLDDLQVETSGPASMWRLPAGEYAGHVVESQNGRVRLAVWVPLERLSLEERARVRQEAGRLTGLKAKAARLAARRTAK